MIHNYPFPNRRLGMQTRMSKKASLGWGIVIPFHDAHSHHYRQRHPKLVLVLVSDMHKWCVDVVLKRAVKSLRTRQCVRCLQSKAGDRRRRLHMEYWSVYYTRTLTQNEPDDPLHSFFIAAKRAYLGLCVIFLFSSYWITRFGMSF